MSAIDECGVLIPAATLEDFPSDLSDSDARSLLAAWTVLWHPKLLADFKQIPTWYRADSPPDPVGGRILTVPHPSLSQLPGGYQEKCRRAEDCRWITGSDRQEMLDALDLGNPSAVNGQSRSVCLDDFFAAGYAVLQVQVMTRRLRYTSNLDEIHLQNRIVAAAEAFLAGQADDAIAGLHDVFDCLAEERDHYFASDPHLIDLTLMTDGTVDSLLSMDDFSGRLPGNPEPTVPPSPPDAPESGQESELERADGTDLQSASAAPAPLATPLNVLIDHDVAKAIGEADPQLCASLREALADGTLGWAGGGPSSDACLDSMTFSQAESTLRESVEATGRFLGVPPSVFARFSGTTPADLTPALVQMGLVGLIPLDFAAGSGFGDESKVILRAGGAEIEALTAKPIDASGDAGFLSLGPRLGEAIDSGEIATALLAHWPRASCDSHRDVRRVASWCLVLGRFWKLDDYFREGEQPYHHGNTRSASPDAHGRLNRQVELERENPLSTAAASFRDAITAETNSQLNGLTALAGKEPTQQGVDGFAEAISQSPAEDDRAVLLANPHSIGCRQTVTVKGQVTKSGDHVYRTSPESRGMTSVTVDIPACGFVVVNSGKPQSSGFSIGKMLGIGRPAPIAEQTNLMNEFMEVTISRESGGISAAFSGSARGNRFSLRLVAGNSEAQTDTVMRCDRLKIATSSAAVGVIETTGQLIGEKDKPIAKFELSYTLRRGSRILEIAGQLTPLAPLGTDPWNDYLAARVAVATEASICRVLIRDKVHRAHGRRLVCPLGLVIDEAERQTLVTGHGLPYHVRVGDRFVDTILSVAGQSEPTFKLNYGFDVANPVETSRSLIAPPMQIPLDPSSQSGPAIGWLAHVAPKDVFLGGLQTRRRKDGKLASIVRVIQTRPKSCTAKLRFCHSIEAAVPVDPNTADPFETETKSEDESGDWAIKDDLISLPLVSHQVLDLLVVFRDV